MKQYEEVAEAMRQNGGYATLGWLNQHVPVANWGTKTPYATIRRIVQDRPEFFKIKPGLWALEEARDAVARQFALAPDSSPAQVETFNHTYYQGLIVEIGNMERFQTFVPHQDKNRLFLARKLSEVATLPQFHTFTYDTLLRRGSTVDITWFNERGLPHAFYEVEHSTDIQNSLLKFLEFQDFRIKFRIVADAVRRKEYDAKLGYSAFAPIRDNTKFIDYDALSNYHDKLSQSLASKHAGHF